MDFFDNPIADNLFISSFVQQDRIDALSNTALSQGIDLYLKKDYEEAARAFERSINLSPTSTFSEAATQHLAQTYLKMEAPDKAVEAYQRGIERHRDSEALHTALGNLLFTQDKYDEAVKAYEAAVNINPSSNNHYSLGQGYLRVEKYEQARQEFNAVVRLEPQSAYGQFGLGQTYAKEGDWENAIEKFDKAIRLDREFFDAYAEKGYALADMGEIEDAKELVSFLEKKDKDLSELLNVYIGEVEPPKLMFAWGSSSFRYTKTINTPISALDAYLEDANASKGFSIKFQFNKEMERASVENTVNWSIARSTSAKPGQAYNFGEEVPDTEVTLPPIPDYVLYDAENLTATVGFTITQNEDADGTLDPGHIVFKFMGKDANGIDMHPKFDEFSGFSGSV